MVFPIYAMTTYLKRKFLKKAFPQLRGDFYSREAFINYYNLEKVGEGVC